MPGSVSGRVVDSFYSPAKAAAVGCWWQVPRDGEVWGVASPVLRRGEGSGSPPSTCWQWFANTFQVHTCPVSPAAWWGCNKISSWNSLMWKGLGFCSTWGCTQVTEVGWGWVISNYSLNQLWKYRCCTRFSCIPWFSCDFTCLTGQNPAWVTLIILLKWMKFGERDLALRGKLRKDSVGEEIWGWLANGITRIIIMDYLSTLLSNSYAHSPHISLKCLELGCLSCCTSYIIQ